MCHVICLKAGDIGTDVVRLCRHLKPIEVSRWVARRGRAAVARVAVKRGKVEADCCGFTMTFGRTLDGTA